MYRATDWFSPLLQTPPPVKCAGQAGSREQRAAFECPVNIQRTLQSRDAAAVNFSVLLAGLGKTPRQDEGEQSQHQTGARSM